MNISGWVQLQFDCKCFRFSYLKVCWKFQSMLKSVMHVESILKKSVKNYKKACWNFQHVLKTVKKSMLKISACSENCKACWKSVFKISAHVENCNACSKLCWIFQGVLKTSWKFQDMLKTLMCVENYVETACWKFQHVLKTVMHVESYVEVSRCVENVYVRHVENHIENHIEVQKKYHHFTTRVEIVRQISFFKFNFTHFSDVKHIYVSLRLHVQNAVPAQPCVGKLGISLVLLNFLHCNFRLWFKTT